MWPLMHRHPTMPRPQHSHGPLTRRVHDALLRLADLTEYYELGARPPLVAARDSLTVYIAEGGLQQHSTQRRITASGTPLLALVRARMGQLRAWLFSPDLPTSTRTRPRSCS